jgi:uncharacterized protein (TIGR00369 family)
MSLSAPPFAGNLERAAEPEWAGWYRWAGIDPFEDEIGPFYVKRDERGIVTGFRPGPKNLNSHHTVHGGCMMTFADFSLFMIAGSGGTEVNGVTVTMNCEFVSAAKAGDLLEARGELVRAGRTMIFARGLITAGERTALTFSGTIMRSPAPPSH